MTKIAKCYAKILRFFYFLHNAQKDGRISVEFNVCNAVR